MCHLYKLVQHSYTHYASHSDTRDSLKLITMVISMALKIVSFKFFDRGLQYLLCTPFKF